MEEGHFPPVLASRSDLRLPASGESGRARNSDTVGQPED